MFRKALALFETRAVAEPQNFATRVWYCANLHVDSVSELGTSIDGVVAELFLDT